MGIETRRSFALIGHVGDGKTSLGEALLHAAGAIAEPGSVEQGSSVLDFDPEEKERHHTLCPTVYSFAAGGADYTLIDTPGDPNFQAAGRIAVHAVDGAVLVVSGVEGARVGTESMWKASRAAGVPAIAFVNGMDHERADFTAALESLKGLETNPVAVALPIGAGPGLKGTVDLLTGKAWVDGKEVEAPGEMADAVEEARGILVEAVAESDDELLEKYLEEGELAPEEVEKGLLAAIRERKLLPVFAGAATAGVGVAQLLRHLVELLPSPAERAPWPAETIGDESTLELRGDASGPFAAVVFKTRIDRYAGALSFFRVLSGTVKSDSAALNASNGVKQRIGKLMRMKGAEHEDVGEAGPGDIVAVAKLKDVHTGNVLTSEKGGVKARELEIPQGVLSYAIEPKEKGDEDKVFNALHRLVEEDPTLHLGRDPATGEFLLSGMGELHIRIALAKMLRLYDVEVNLKTPKVPYRETIKGRAEHVEGKLKKQSGGKGMFGVCFLTVEPLPRGEGIQFSDEIVGGAIPRGLIPAVEKGVLEAAESGPLAGYPVVDVKVRCIDGKHHSVDSNEMAFKIAGSMGFKAAMEQARPTLLEPVMMVEIAVPEEAVGDVMGDVSGRRGRVQSSEVRGSNQIIKAQVPMAEMLEYSSTLTSLTGGKGAFHMELSHYDEVPSQVREKIIAEAREEGSETS